MARAAAIAGRDGTPLGRRVEALKLDLKIPKKHKLRLPEPGNDSVAFS